MLVIAMYTGTDDRRVGEDSTVLYHKILFTKYLVNIESYC